MDIGLDPPLQAFLAQALREYRDKFHEKVLGRELRKPWMKYREIRLLEEVLAALRPRRALEWGAGFGTTHFARLLAPGGKWMAVEHDPEWAGRVRERAGSGSGGADAGGTDAPDPAASAAADPDAAAPRPPSIEVHAVPAESEPWPLERGEGDYADFRTYVDYPRRFAPFDFILIDGRAREACLRCAREILSPGGIVALHDANRPHLRPVCDLFPRHALFRDYRVYSGGIWIGGVDRDPAALIDLARHRRIWALYNALGRGFRL